MMTWAGDTYKCLRSCETNALEIYARHQGGLASNGIGECLGHFKGFGVGVELGVGGGRHGGDDGVSFLDLLSTSKSRRFR
jgi:hypothetical protein